MPNDLTAFTFPGQGAQSVGMGSRLLGADAAARLRLEEAEAVLGWPLVRLVEEGPEAALQNTANAQPALLAVEVACAEALGRRGYAPDVVLGHSVGEYAALVVSGALGFAEAVRLVAVRGRLMDAAAQVAPGGMVAVLGLDAEGIADVVAACRPLGVLEVTNHNAPAQVVLSGEAAPLAAAVAALRERRQVRAVPLRVSAPFHCSLMWPLAAELDRALQQVELRAPGVVFIDNVTGSPEADPARIRAKLVEQLHRPVLWQRSVETACDLGVRRFVEAGPGQTLTGLVRRIRGDVERLAAETLLR